MAETDYHHIMSEIETLTLPDQLRLLEEVAAIIRRKSCACRTRSIMELKGKGRDIWKGLDVKTFLDEERSSWNG